MKNHMFNVKNIFSTTAILILLAFSSTNFIIPLPVKAAAKSDIVLSVANLFDDPPGMTTLGKYTLDDLYDIL